MQGFVKLASRGSKLQKLHLKQAYLNRSFSFCYFSMGSCKCSCNDSTWNYHDSDKSSVTVMNIVIQLNELKLNEYCDLPNEDMVGFKELQGQRPSVFFFVSSTTVKTAPQAGSWLLFLCLTQHSITSLFTALPFLQRSSAQSAPQGNGVGQGACPHSWQLEHRMGADVKQTGWCRAALGKKLTPAQVWSHRTSTVTLLIGSRGPLEDLQHLCSMFLTSDHHQIQCCI